MTGIPALIYICHGLITSLGNSNSTLSENLDVVEQILRAVMFENAEYGCMAENYLDAFICKRYAAMLI